MSSVSELMARSVIRGLAVCLLVSQLFIPGPPRVAPAVPEPAPFSRGGIGGHLWMHLDQPGSDRTHFRMYQFNPTGSDGRGTGWYHEGDFTEWLTETLRYEVRGQKLILHFELANETVETAFRIERTGEGKDRAPRLVVDPDPRRYWKGYDYYASKDAAGAAWLEKFKHLTP